MANKNQTVVVLDFGGQYKELIARRVRECKVHSQILAGNTPMEKLREIAPIGIILTGGPHSVYAETDSRFRLEVRFSFFIQFLQMNFKVSDKAEEERTCIVVSGKKCHKRTYLGMTREEDTRTGFQIKRFC